VEAQERAEGIALERLMWRRPAGRKISYSSSSLRGSISRTCWSSDGCISLGSCCRTPCDFVFDLAQPQGSRSQLEGRQNQSLRLSARLSTLYLQYFQCAIPRLGELNKFALPGRMGERNLSAALRQIDYGREADYCPMGNVVGLR
jgi:hypothetical protein